MDEHPFWRDIEGLGRTRAKVVIDELGVRTLAEFARCSPDEIAEALRCGDKSATDDEIADWLEQATTAASEVTSETAPTPSALELPAPDDTATIVRTEVFQPVDADRAAIEYSADRTDVVPLRAGSPLRIDVELTSEPAEVDGVVLERLGGPERYPTCSPVTDHEHPSTVRAVAYGVPSGVFRIVVRQPGGGRIAGPKVQLIG